MNRVALALGEVGGLPWPGKERTFGARVIVEGGKRMPAGRPSKFSPELCAEVCRRIATGQSMAEVGRDPAMPSDHTLWRWMITEEEFRTAYVKAKEECSEFLVDEMLDIADDARNDWMTRQVDGETIKVPDKEHISRTRLRIDTRKWIAAKLKPKKYGDAMIHRGDDEAPIQVNHEIDFSGLSPDERAAIRAILSNRLEASGPGPTGPGQGGVS